MPPAPSALVVLLGLLVVASLTDVTRHKIYNWTTYPGIVAGFVLNFAELGRAGLEASVLGFLLCGGVMLVCFVLFNVGGGDVKLIALMGACLGVQRGIEAMLWTFVLGAVVGVSMLVWRIGTVRWLGQVLRHLGLVLRAGSWIPLAEAERRKLEGRLFLAPSALVGVCLVATRAGILW